MQKSIIIDTIIKNYEVGNFMDLKLKNKREWFIALLLGFFIGLAVIIPGVSGATLAIIFGLHAKLLYSFDNIFKHFKQCFLFLIPIGIGIVVGFLFGFLVVQKLFDTAPFIIICLFAGLMIGSFPAVKDEIKGVKFDKTKTILFVIGIVVPIIVGIVSIVFNSTSAQPIDAGVLITILYFIMGFFLSLTQLVPGLSCSALLMAFGQYSVILATAKTDYLFDNLTAIIPLISLAVGFCVGIIAVSKLVNRLLLKHRDNTYTTIVGLALGSIISMFLNPEIWAVYKGWKSPSNIAIDICCGAVLMAIGIIGAYMLVKYQRSKNKEASKQNTDTTK